MLPEWEQQIYDSLLEISAHPEVYSQAQREKVFQRAFVMLKSLVSTFEGYRIVLKVMTEMPSAHQYLLDNLVALFYHCCALAPEIVKKKMEALFLYTIISRIVPIELRSQFLNVQRGDYNNSILHFYIASEDYQGIPLFLDLTAQYGFSIDLNCKDTQGKTPFLFAIKMGVTPIEAIERLITLENYNEPDDNGMTPIMLACAMRRLDVIQLILQYEVKAKGLDVLDAAHPENWTIEQKECVAKFLNSQVHLKTGKTLGHFAVMRCGTDYDFEKDSQFTVVNLLKSVGVDRRRDERARFNALLLSNRVCRMSPQREKSIFGRDVGVTKQMIFAALSDFWGDESVLSATQGNVLTILTNILAYRYTDIRSNENLLAFCEDVAKHVVSYTGRSVAEATMSHTPSVLTYLAKAGLNFAKKQNNGKTPYEYVQLLQEKYRDDKNVVTQADRDYLFPALPFLFEHQKLDTESLTQQQDQSPVAECRC